MNAFRVLLCGAAVLTAIGVAPAIGQERGADAPPVQKYLSDIKLKHESADTRMPTRKDSVRAEHRRQRPARPWPGSEVTYEVQPWTDGMVQASGWCFVVDPEFAGLGSWMKCAGD
jgi:hypothetical protein